MSNATAAANAATQQQQGPKLSALQQAEIMEKQKLLGDRERKLNAIARSMQMLNQKQFGLTRERNRAVITMNELAKYEDDHVCYQAVGRMFLKKPLPKMYEDLKNVQNKCDNNHAKVDEDKKRLQRQQEEEEVRMRQDYAEFMQLLDKLGLAVRQQ